METISAESLPIPVTRKEDLTFRQNVASVALPFLEMRRVQLKGPRAIIGKVFFLVDFVV